MINFITNGGGSGEIRGIQMAQKLKAKVNPKFLPTDDIKIYIKDYPIGPVLPHTYIDVVEDSRGLRWVKDHPEVGIISSSLMIDAYLRQKIPTANIVYIPQHHCNFERFVKPHGELKVIGIIGNENTYQLPIADLKERLLGQGIKLKTLIKKKFKDRKEVCEFYKQIDVQIVFRKDDNLRNPLKLINAMSFGIPTIAYPEPSFVMENLSFLRANNIEDIMKAINILKVPDFYQTIAIRGINETQDYHIDFISELYKQLK